MFLDSISETLWCVLMWGVEISDHDFEFYRKEVQLDTFDTVADMLAGMVQMPNAFDESVLDSAMCVRELAIDILSEKVNELAGPCPFPESAVRSFVETELEKSLALKVSDVVDHAMGWVEPEYSETEVDEMLWEAMFNADYGISAINSASFEDKIDMIGVEISTGEVKLTVDYVRFCMLYTDSASTLYEYIFKDFFPEDRDNDEFYS